MTPIKNQVEYSYWGTYIVTETNKEATEKKCSDDGLFLPQATEFKLSEDILNAILEEPWMPLKITTEICYFLFTRLFYLYRPRKIYSSIRSRRERCNQNVRWFFTLASCHKVELLRKGYFCSPYGIQISNFSLYCWWRLSFTFVDWIQTFWNIDRCNSFSF
jgi:hypothetical protein